MDTVTTYYIASCECYEARTDWDNSVVTEDGKVVWLSYDHMYHYPDCSSKKEDAYKFLSPEEAKRAVKDWSGHPWFYRLKPKTLKIYKVTERKLIEYTEEEVKVERKRPSRGR